MKLLSSDILAVGVSTVIITTFSGLLYFDFTKRIEVANAKEVGSITFKKRVAQRKYGRQVIWEDIEQKSLVYNNDSIRTSDTSEAVIHLKDGTSIELDENSMILLAEAAGAININFTQGTIYAKRGTLASKDVSQVNILAKDATVSIENSDVKLSKMEDKDLNLTVSKGEAKIKTATDEKIINKDQTAVVLRDTKETKVEDQRLKLVSPVPNRYYVTTAAAAPVEFNWEPVTGGGAVTLEISADERFARKVTARKAAGSALTENLAGGTWFWRLRAANPVTKKIDTSEVRKLVVLRDKEVALIYPPNGERVAFGARPPIINFRWGKNDIASEYVLELSQDPAFAGGAKSIQTTLNELAVDTLKEGTHYWRVKTRLAFGDTAYSGISPANRLVIEKARTFEPPALIVPPDNNRVSVTMLKSRGVIFSWKADPQFTRYELSIAKDREFKDIDFRVVNNGNFYTLQEALAPGTRFWRVRALGDTPETTILSPSRSFTVIQTEMMKLNAPMNRSAITLKEEEKYAAVDFAWSRSNIEGGYLLEVSRDRSFLPLFDKRLVPGDSARMDRLEPGAYYWRVKLVDKNKSEILVSEAGAFTVQKQEKKPPVAVPKAGMDVPEEGVKKAAGKNAPVLQIITPVKDSAIYVNRKLAGFDAVTLNPAPGQKLRIEVVAKGYTRFVKDVQLKEGETLEVSAQLAPLRRLGRIKWTEKLLSSIASKPLYKDNVIVVNTNNGFLAGLTREGRVLWKIHLKSGFESTPAANETTVYVVTVDGNLYSISVKDGTINWNRKTDGPLLFGSKPLVTKDRVFVATSYGIIHAYAHDGKELWKTDGEAGIFCSLATDGDMLFAGADDRGVYAFNAKNGARRWAFVADSRIISSSPKISGGVLFIGSYSGSFYAIDTRTGKQKWSYKAGDAILSTPAFSSLLVYFGSNDGYIYALNSEKGTLAWKFYSGNKITAEPDISGDYLYITSGRSVFALDPMSGAVQWRQDFASDIKTPATAVGNDVIVGLANGDLVSLRSNLNVVEVR